tara:strand:- start:2008 stop:3234 length:1227 start_codon:yes stop_codon:yes gene_type:complete
MFFEYEKKEKESIDDYTWIKDGALYTPKHELSEIKEKFTKKEIILKLCQTIYDHQIPFPYKKHSVAKAKGELSKLFNTDYQIDNFEWYSDLCEDIKSFKYRDKYILVKTNHIGSYVSDMFCHRYRLRAQKNKYANDRPGVVGLWEYLLSYRCEKESDIDWILYMFINGIFHFSDEIDHKAVYTSGRLSIGTVSQFKPATAKAIYNFFGAKRVLDFCSGWGDRLVGFHASNAESYIGIDPNSDLHPQYEKIHNFCGSSKRVEFICSPAEDVDYSNLRYDFAFTSPPYFDMELYNEEETQSVKRYPKLDLWLKDFLFKSLSKIYESLDVGGRIAVNISDNAYRKIFVCKPMLEHMKSIGATYEGTIGYGLARRPSDFEDKLSKEKSEPIFIWSKGEVPEPNQHSETFFGV